MKKFLTEVLDYFSIYNTIMTHWAILESNKKSSYNFFAYHTAINIYYGLFSKLFQNSLLFFKISNKARHKIVEIYYGQYG